MTLKRIPGSYLVEALDLASQLAHAKEAREIELPHIVFGAFSKLQKYQARILLPKERNSQLNSIVIRICTQFNVPGDLPEKNGACHSFIVERTLADARLRAVKSGRRFVLLEDLIVVLLNSRLIMKLFIGRDREQSFLAEVRERCMHPLRNNEQKRQVAVRPQFNKRRNQK